LFQVRSTAALEITCSTRQRGARYHPVSGHGVMFDPTEVVGPYLPVWERKRLQWYLAQKKHAPPLGPP